MRGARATQSVRGKGELLEETDLAVMEGMNQFMMYIL